VLHLNELLIFPHGLDGAHIWEAGIILARFILFNDDLFAGKEVLELGSGVGIGGISMLKFTKARHVSLSDFNDFVLSNIKQNLKRESFLDKTSEVVKLD